MRRFLVFVPVVALVALVGCDNACEQLGDVAVARYERCGIDVEPQDDTGEPAECTEDDARVADCMIDCYKDAPCEALDGTDMGAAMSHIGCLANCAGAAQ